MSQSKGQGLFRILFTLVLALLIGALVIVAIGENPLAAYGALLSGAFKGARGFGSTLAMFTPLLLTSAAFAVAAKAGMFNVGVEGAVFLGGLAAAYVGVQFAALPGPLLILVCFIVAVVVAALWALIPALLKVYLNVNEVCVTILMNSVAFYITSYFVSGPMSAGTTLAQSKPVAATLPQFMKPSSVNVGLFIAIIVVIAVIWLLNRTTFGYQVRAVGTNPKFAETSGIDPKKVMIRAMMLSGAIGGIAGCIEVLGVHGYFLNNFAAGLGASGMLASLIVNNNLAMTPIMAFFLAVLKSGAMGMQQTTGVPKSIVDMISAIFIIIACMNIVFSFKGKKKSAETAVKKEA